jgi:hypothetical protein
VSGTEEDVLGLGATFGAGRWLTGRIELETADREFDGDYRIAFEGELEDVRQYNIADRERDAAEARLDFALTERANLGLGYRFSEDDYPATEFGLREGDERSADLSFGYAVGERVDLFLYADVSESDRDFHLRTKCGNCAPPLGADWEPPWEVPNFDWFTDYTDETTALGGGLSFETGRKTRWELAVHHVDASIAQRTRNPGPPVDLLDPARPVATVAVGHDFPDQESTLFGVELRLSHRISDRLSAGLWYLYEDFDLEDFQWDVLDPYGASFLEIDDATRYLFLDSRYGDYEAQVLQLFLRLAL